MIALLRANPDAFIGGNINQLKQGAVLRIPPATRPPAIEARRQAMALVRGQVRQWRDARRAAPQPAADRRTPRDRAIHATATAPAPVARRDSGARLEIVPPGASRATRAGTQSGINAGGEGKMLRQELQQTKESLAARDAELQELKGRVAELEKLQADQQQLLALKDSELAAAQQRLAASNKAPAPTAAPAQAQTAATAKATAPAEAQGSTLPWVLGGVGVLALVLLVGGWLMRGARQADAALPCAAGHDEPSSLAAAFGRSRRERPSRDADRRSVVAPTPMARVRCELRRSSTRRRAPHCKPRRRSRAKPAARIPTRVKCRPRSGTAASASSCRRGRARSAGACLAHRRRASPSVDERSVPRLSPRASGGERLELAQAYLDLGDRDSARQLLSEVVVNGDHAARQQASRMLRELE